MTTFEILSVAILLLGAIIAVYVKVSVEVARIDERIKAVNRDLLQKEIGGLLSDKINREDHDKIISKIDHLIDIYIKK